MSKSHDIIRGGHGKNLRRFRTTCHVRCLQTEVSQKKNRSVENDSVGFGVKVTVDLGFDFKTFLYRQQRTKIDSCEILIIFLIRLIILIY